LVWSARPRICSARSAQWAGSLTRFGIPSLPVSQHQHVRAGGLVRMCCFAHRAHLADPRISVRVRARHWLAELRCKGDRGQVGGSDRRSGSRSDRPEIGIEREPDLAFTLPGGRLTLCGLPMEAVSLGALFLLSWALRSASLGRERARRGT
jgi:hypothetical protein